MSQIRTNPSFPYLWNEFETFFKLLNLVLLPDARHHVDVLFGSAQGLGSEFKFYIEHL